MKKPRLTVNYDADPIHTFLSEGRMALFTNQTRLDSLLEETHTIATQVAALQVGFNRLVERQLDDIRTRYDAKAQLPVGTALTTVTVPPPTNNAVIVNTLLIVVGSGGGTVTITLGNDTLPPLPNPAGGFILFNPGEEAWIIDNTTPIKVTLQNAAALYVRVTGKMVGNAGLFSTM